MLVRHIMTLDLPVETLKAWSQNLEHQGLLTTLTSYGSVATPRQAELIRRGLRSSESKADDPLNADVIAEVMRRFQGPSQVRNRFDELGKKGGTADVRSA